MNILEFKYVSPSYFPAAQVIVWGLGPFSTSVPLSLSAHQLCGSLNSQQMTNRILSIVMLPKLKGTRLGKLLYIHWMKKKGIHEHTCTFTDYSIIICCLYPRAICNLTSSIFEDIIGNFCF